MPEVAKGDTGGIPRYRPTGLPALFSQGFRPFFAAAALWAPLSLGLWMLELAGYLDLPTAFDPVAWHAHEMIFGFAVAAMAGHLMTTIPNWTGRMPLQGISLLLLASLWLMGRIAVATSALIGAVPAAIADLGFLLALAAVMAREIIAGRNWRNLPIVAALLLLLAANATMHLATIGAIESGQVGMRGGVAVFVLLIALVGGRMIPSFTRNRLARLGTTARPAAFGLFDRATLVLVAGGIAAWATGLPATVTGGLLLLAAAATIIRLVRWHGLLTIGEPSLWALHLGHVWLGLGLGLLGASESWPVLPSVAGVHALTAGAIGTTILGVMSRATLSHIGRRTASPRSASAIYGLVTVAAALRVLAPFVPDHYLLVLWAAGLAWISAFAVFATAHAGLLLRPRENSR